MFGVKTKNIWYKRRGTVFLIREILFTSDWMMTNVCMRFFLSKARPAAILPGGGRTLHRGDACSVLLFSGIQFSGSDRVKIGYFRLAVEELEKHFEEKKRYWKKIWRNWCFWSSARSVVSVTTDEKGYQGVEGKSFHPASSRVSDSDTDRKDQLRSAAKQKDCYIGLSGTVYLCQSDFKETGIWVYRALRILKVILSYDYLWMNIRVKGGAYGCMSN